MLPIPRHHCEKRQTQANETRRDEYTVYLASSRALRPGVIVIPHLIYSLGALLCVLNVYVSVLRYPLLRCLGTPSSEIEQVPGAPLIGTVLVVVGWSNLDPARSSTQPRSS